MPRYSSLRVVAVIVVALLWPARAQAQLADTALYTVNNTTTLSVVTNRTTGTTAALATLSFSTSALARDPVTKRIFYLATNAATPVGRVAYYDPKTGTNTIINATGSPGGDNIVKLTFYSGQLYGIGDVAHGSLLYTIDPTSGVYTSHGAVHVTTAAGELFPDNGDLAFDAFGTLYANANRPAGAAGTSLYTIDLNTRIATVIGTINATNTQAALTFAAGVLYSGGGGGQWYTVNTTTGVGTLVTNAAYTWYDFATGPPVADMQMTATASAGFTAGANGTYTLTAKNNGPYPATGTITVTDTLPPGLNYSSATGAGWACSASGQVVNCTRAGPVASGTTLSAITVTVAITSAVAPSITNSAWVWASTIDDQDQANNESAVTSAVTVRSVATTPDGATASQLPSNATQYTQLFTVKNTGSMSDSYSLAATVAPAGVVAIVSVNGVAGATGTTGVIASLAQVTVTVVYTVQAGAATGSSAKLTLTATSTALGTTKDPGDLTVTVVRAGLTMSKQLYRDDQTTLVTPAAGVKPGEFVQYKVMVTSTGGAGASSVSVSDPIPGAVTFVTATGDTAGWTITNAANTVAASLSGALASGSTRYFWIRVQVK